MTLRVERSTSFEGLKTPWSDLLDKSPEGSLFLSYEWASTWWKHFGSGADLWLLLVWDEDELLGVAPMTIRRVRYSGLPVRMLGMFANKHVSRADILSPTRPAEVMHALVRYWKRHHGFWDVLKLEGIPLSSATNQLLPAEVRQSAMCGFPFEKTNDLYYLPTQEPWPSYYKTRPDSFKKAYRNARNRLYRAGKVEFLKYVDPADLEPTFQALWELQQRSWKRNDPFASNKERDRAFYTDLATACLGTQHAGYEIRLLKVNDEVIAGLNMIIFKKVVYLFVIYYDERFDAMNPGRMLIANVLEEYLGNDDIREIDFNGESRFVRSWTDAAHSYGVMSACNGTVYSRVLGFLKQVKRQCVGRDAADSELLESAS